MSALLILGGGGNGRVIADIAASDPSTGWDRIAFLDDSLPVGSSIDSWKVIGACSELPEVASEFSAMVIGFGDNALRHEWVERSTKSGLELSTIIAPSAMVSSRAVLGAGTVVMPQGVVNIGSRLGSGCLVNTGATIDHDCHLGHSVHIAPGAHLGGDVRVGDRSWIGIGASVRHGVTIGRDVMVGAGAAVVGDLPDQCTAFGVPARMQG